VDDIYTQTEKLSSAGFALLNNITEEGAHNKRFGSPDLKKTNSVQPE